MGSMFDNSAVPAVDVADIPDDAYVVDVREQDEWDMAHVEGSRHVPMSQFIERIDEIPRDRTLTVLCAVGGRSAQVTAWLNAQGYDAVNVTGGIQSWMYAGRPVVDGAGNPVAV